MKTESTGLRLSLWLGIGMLAFSSLAHAAAPVRCSLSSGPISTAYGSALNVVSGSFIVTCNNAGTATYYVGASTTNLPARAVSGVSFILYGLYKDPGCSQPWNNTTALLSASVISPMTTTFPFYICIPANQTGLTVGTYTDNITLAFTAASTASPSNPATFSSIATVPVSIVAPASCSMTTSPGSVTFNYTSFSPADVLANTSFATTCNSGLPYTIEFNTPSGTITGVNYALALNTSPNTGGSTLLSSTGTGAAQTFYINGKIMAGQSGTCGGPTCAGSNPHTVIITY